MFATKELHNLAKQRRSQLMAFIRARNIAYNHIHSQRCGPDRDSWRRRKSFSHVKRHGALPLLFCQPDVRLGLSRHGFMHRFSNWVRINACGNGDLDFIPEPLATGGKIEVVAFNGKILTTVTFLPVGWPASDQLPVSR